jgi:phosphoribosyl-AMP cyclohydrolase
MKQVKNENIFSERISTKQVEEGNELAPKFDSKGLIPVVTTDFETGELLMHAYMDPEAFKLTIQKGEMHYFSRSRGMIWHKGETSGFVQKVNELVIDDDQDAVWAKVTVTGGASCHVGYRSCFYRKIRLNQDYKVGKKIKLSFSDSEKVFDPEIVYLETSNPTKL